MVAHSQRLRPLTFYGRVPKGTTNVDICKELVKRFSQNELTCVQDFGAGRFEVTFANEAAVGRFLAKPAITVRNVEVKFEYRGVRVKTVRVLGYPNDVSDTPLLSGFRAYGKVVAIDYEHVPEFKSVLTGNRRVRVEMARPIPNLLPVGDRIVQCEYDGVVRQCRRCFFPGHHAADCKVPQCERCGEFGHARCLAVCPRCGEDHPLSACKVRTYSSVAARAPAAFSSTQVTSGAAEGQVELPKDPEGSPLPAREPVRAAAPGGGEQGEGSELAEAPPPSTAMQPPAAPADTPAATADVPAASAGVPAAPAVEEDQETMEAEWTVVARGRKRRARSRDSSEERSVAAVSGGPGDLEEALPGLKRTAPTDLDDESTSSTVVESTVGEMNLSSCPNCGPGSCECSLLSEQVYSSTNEDSSSSEGSSH